MATKVPARTGGAASTGLAIPAPPQPEVAAQAGQQIRSHQIHPIRNGAMVAACGIGAAAAAPLVGAPGIEGPLAAAGIIGGLATSSASGLLRRRRRLHDHLIEGLSPIITPQLGRIDTRTVRILGWTLGWPGHPRRIRLQISARVLSADPKWKLSVLQMVTELTGQPYEIAKLDARRRVMMLRLQPPQTVGEETVRDVVQQRAGKAVEDLMGATAQVEGLEFGLKGDLARIEVTHQNPVKLANPGYRKRIETTISTIFPGRWRARWDLEGDRVVFELRPALPTSVWMPAELPDKDLADLLANYRNVVIPIAVDEDGKQVTWHPARIPQMMICGGTGTGKTATVQAIVAKIAQFGWPVWISDPKRVEFLHFRDWPNVQIVAGSVPHQIALVHRAWQLMEHRYELIETGRARIDDFEPLVVVLDEYADFRSNVLTWYAQIKGKGDPSKPPVFAEVASLARKARTARIHMVLLTQRPDAEFTGGEMRDNFGMRASISRVSPQGAMMMWDNAATGVSLPRGVRQRAMVTGPDGVPIEAQCVRFPDIADAARDPESQEAQVVNSLKFMGKPHPRYVIVPPQADTILDKEENEVEVPLSYWDYQDAAWDLATNRPDLDPLTRGALEHTATGFDGTQLSSTAAALGLVPGLDGGAARRGAQPATSSQAGAAADPSPAAEEDATLVGDYSDYEDAIPCSPQEIVPGDLIQLEEGADEWVVVDEPPEEDPMDPDSIWISWRSDDDETGALQVGAEETLHVRRPRAEPEPN